MSENTVVLRVNEDLHKNKHVLTNEPDKFRLVLHKLKYGYYDLDDEKLLPAPRTKLIRLNNVDHLGDELAEINRLHDKNLSRNDLINLVGNILLSQ